MKHFLLILFALAAAAQLAVPLRLAWRAETALADGVAVKFALVLRDPHDPLRGKYVRLSFAWDPVPVPDGLELPPGPHRVIALVETDADGFGRIAGIAGEPPAEGLWFHVSAWSNGRGEVHLRPDFDRYFVNEHAAAEAEALYREAAAARPPGPAPHGPPPPPPAAFALVRFWDGEAQLEEVFVEGESLAAQVRAQRLWN